MCIRDSPVPRQSWFRLDTSGKTVVFCVEYKGKAGNWAEYEGKRMDDRDVYKRQVLFLSRLNPVRKGNLL